MIKLQSKKNDETSAIIAAARELLQKNRRTVAGHTFTMPSPHEYRHQYLWDSCFHAIALRQFDIAAAENELRSLLALQRKKGMVPHESKVELLTRIPTPLRSRVTQPPLIARAALDVYRKSGNKSFLAEVFPKLQLYHKWLGEAREANGVLRIADSNESGEDNSAIYDTELLLPWQVSYMRWLTAYMPLFPQWKNFRSVTQTSVYADALECMAEIAKILGEMRTGSRYSKKRAAVVAAMRKAFRQKDGLCHSITSKGKQVSCMSHEIFSPLFAAAVTKKEAVMLVEEHLLNAKEFWTPFPIPTVAVNEPKFSAKGYWRGPMWPNINWMLYRGLLRYGFKAVADELLQKTIAAVKKSGFREYYNPLTGDGLGAKDFTWGTLILDMILQK